MRTLYFIAFSIFSLACNSANNTTDSSNTNAIESPKQLQYEIVKIYPHDTSSYTQGLEWNGSQLIEGTGNYGKSILHILDSNMQSLGKKVKLSAEDFGEGTTLFKDKIYQLTWKEHKVYVYNASTLEKIKELYWPYEGWGLTHNDSSLIVSTGGSNIYFVNPDNFAIQRTVGVYNKFGYVSDINELEFFNGKIAANIYLTNDIIFIDPNSGLVKETLNFDQLLAQAKVHLDPTTIDPGYVLNGIAYHPARKTLFITGKCWPIMAEIIVK
jgi:glutamine cyclotransferase